MFSKAVVHRSVLQIRCEIRYFFLLRCFVFKKCVGWIYKLVV